MKMYTIERARKIYIRESRRSNDVFHYMLLRKDGDRIKFMINKDNSIHLELVVNVEEFVANNHNLQQEIKESIKYNNNGYVSLINSIVLVCSFPENNCIISFDVPKRKPMNRFGQASDGLNEMKKLTNNRG